MTETINGHVLTIGKHGDEMAKVEAQHASLETEMEEIVKINGELEG